MEFIQQNIWTVLLAAVSGLMLVMPGFRRFSGIKQIGPQEAVLLMNHEDALVLDVREQSEFIDGHIAKARHIPLGGLAKRLDELEKYKDKPIIAVCRSGSRSGMACRTLRKAGFERLHNLDGGMIAWDRAGLPKERK